jgi:iron complex outermembrane recepter protein
MQGFQMIMTPINFSVQTKGSVFTRRGVVRQILILALTILLWAIPSMADEKVSYLKSLNIEDLLDAEVTSVSKKSERWADATAAVFVITADEIRRTGVRTIAEALRMAPGIHVAQMDANKWVVSARGFSDTFSNKLLVLIDGRSVYTPLYSGVFWDIQDTMIEDIDRIEVIRGPGATLWGANAVNGVVNIITKTAQETQGALVTVGAGSHEEYNAAVRYGDQLGSDGAWRIYAKGFRRGHYVDANGDNANDEWDSIRSGFRMDADLTYQDALMIQGDIYQGGEEQTLDLPETLTTPAAGPQAYSADFFGADILARWRRSYGDKSDLTLQFYYDRTERQQVVLEEIRDTLDIDFQHRFQMAAHQEVVWGLGYRWTQDDTEPGDGISMNPDSRLDQLLSAFVQDEITLSPDKWWLTLGSKFEHNDYTGFEIQPSMRLRWKPTRMQTVWAAVSRAVRTPSRADHHLRSNRDIVVAPGFPFPTTYQNTILGSDDYESEELQAYELGYRWQADPTLSIDTATFYNQYDNLRTIEQNTSMAFVEMDPTPHVVVPYFIDNKMEGKTFGIELTTTWHPFPFWKLTAGYTWMQMLLDTDADSLDSGAEQGAGYSPVNQVQLRSSLDLAHGWSFDTELYYVDELEQMDIPAYTRLDLHLGWQPDDRWEFSLNAENLLDDQHEEFGERTDVIPSQIPRQVYGQVTLRF